jgi:hypothetical protein
MQDPMQRIDVEMYEEEDAEKHEFTDEEKDQHAQRCLRVSASVCARSAEAR